MATGDDATAAGFALVNPATADIRDGANQINLTRDYVAQTKTWATSQLSGKAGTSHTHAGTDITSGTIPAARLPNHSAALLTSGTLDSDRLGSTVKAQGPTSGSYSRSATGSNWYQVWMNDDLLFMRNTSSARYKMAIETLSGGSALDIIQNLRPVFFKAKADPEGPRHVGLIAEEVFEVLPEVVPLWDGEPEAVNYEFIVAPLIGAVQELAAQVAELRAEIQELKGGQ
jgi:hypothetical protein